MTRTAALLLAFVLSAGAQPVREWTGLYNGIDSYEEWAEDIAVDRQGNVYVTGYSYAYFWRAFATVKYYPNGETAWTRVYHGLGPGTDQATALAVDDSGNCYVTGWGIVNNEVVDIALIKYLPDGDTAWVRRYRSPGGNNQADDVVLDREGNIVVVGASWSDVTDGFDAVVLKYRPDGTLAWDRTWDGPGYWDALYCVTVDRANNIICGGYTETVPSHLDWLVMRWDPDGDLHWATVIESFFLNINEVWGVAVDSAGYAHAAGDLGYPSASSDMTLARFSPAGETLWTRHYAGNASVHDYCRDVAIDPAGNIVMSGYTWWQGNVTKLTAVRYRPDGTMAWARDWLGPFLYTTGSKLALDRQGAVYVVGYGRKADTVDNDDCVLVKWDSAGNFQWVETFEQAGRPDHFYDVTVDGQGNVYALGRAWVSFPVYYDYLTIKYSQATGAAERRTAAGRPAPCATVVRSVLRLPPSPLTVQGSLFDMTGRAVMSLEPGENDVSRLAPGVYFVKPGAPSANQRVVIAR